MSERLCEFPGCNRPHKARGLCPGHVSQLRRGLELRPLAYRTPVTKYCSFPGCGRKHLTMGLCSGHNWHRRNGQELKPLQRKTRGCDGRSAECRMEHRSYDPQGYVVQLHQGHHPNAVHVSGRMYEHTLVMSEILGRPLAVGEEVHHKNGVRDDNRPENLELWVRSQPAGQRPEDLLEWADEIIARYRTRKPWQGRLVA